jgi:hypothetical protein
MSKFVVAPHFRLHEWVAEEKGYFAAEGLDYEFRETMDSTSGSGHHIGNKVGAYQTLEAGRTCNVSGACHWTMNVAASNGHGKLYADAYSVSPAGVFVAPESPIKTPADLAGVAISVGYQSGSHYATIQGLDQYLKPDQINLSFNDGLLFSRMELLIDRKVPAASLFSGPYYFLEQLGFRKVIDTTFMNSRPASTPRWIRGAGAPASGWCSSRIRSRPSTSPSSGSSSTAFFRAAKWAPATTKPRSSTDCRVGKIARCC